MEDMLQLDVFHGVGHALGPHLAGRLVGRSPAFAVATPGVVQGAEERQAAREAFFGVLRQGAGDDGPLRLGQAAQFRFLVHVLVRQHARVLAAEWPLRRQQLLVDDRERILIAGLGDLASERLGQRIQRGDAAEQAGASAASAASEMFDEPEVGDLDAITDEEEVARLDVEVLKAVLLAQVVEGRGRIAQVAKQVIARDADQTGGLALDAVVVQVLVGQLHHDDKLALDHLDAVHAEDEWVAHFLDAVERLHLLLGARAIDIQRVEIAEDELDGLEEPARGLALPDLAEAAAAERLDETVPGDWLRVGFSKNAHARGPSSVKDSRRLAFWGRAGERAW